MLKVYFLFIFSLFHIFLVIESFSFLPRQRLLVIGSGGAVGFSAIQLSVAAGCQVVTTCGSKSIDRVLAAGAEQAVDYTAEVMMLSLNDL